MEVGAGGGPGVTVPVALRAGPGAVTNLHLGMEERIVRETIQRLSRALDHLVVSPTCR